MKYKTLLIASFSMLSSFSGLAGSQYDWKVSQMDFGGTGLLQTPSGRMSEEGEFNFGATLSDDYHHYTVSLQLMPWLETVIHYTRVPDLKFSDNEDYSGDNLYTDKGIDFKVRVIEESYWLPETSIGVRDFGGTGLFDGEYIAATKRFGMLDFSLGLGWGYLGQSASITNPFCSASDKYCHRPSDYKGNGGSFDVERWFKGPAALFGGVEYQTPYAPLRLKLEYDGNDYSQDLPTLRGKELKQRTPWNIGANYRISDWGDLKISYQRGNTLSLGFNLSTNFNELDMPWRDTPKPHAKLDASSNNPDWHQVARELENNAGYQHNQIFVANNTITVKGEQDKYRDRTQALDRASAILNNAAPPAVQEFAIVEQKNGMSLTETKVNRKKYVEAANFMSTDASVTDAFARNEPISEPKNKSTATTQETWDYGIDPVLKQSLGAPEAFYLFSLGLNANAHWWLNDNLELGSSVYVNLVDNYDKFNYVENSPHVRNYSTPRVRTMFRAYVHENPVRLNHLQLTWFEQPFSNVYTQLYGGYLEMMFAGIGGEVLYRPLDKNWAIGFDANVISQRTPDSWFKTYKDNYFFYDENTCDDNTPSCQAYVLSRGSTGHLSMYYMPNWSILDNTLFKLHVGKFLGGDVGAQLDFSKQFDSGVTVGAYLTKTDLSAEEYGEGSYNKGFYISIPMDVMTIKPSTSRAKISWEPITRDGGQMLRKQHYLFEKTDARSPWFQRPSQVNKN